MLRHGRRWRLGLLKSEVFSKLRPTEEEAAEEHAELAQLHERWEKEGPLPLLCLS